MCRFLAVIGAIILGLTILPAVPSASAQDRTERVSFASGRTSKVIRDSIRGYDGVVYLVRARAGQRLAVSMRTSNPGNFFNVSADGAQEAMFIGSISGDEFETIVPSSGDYRVQVYLMRNVARRGERADFSLTVAIKGGDSNSTGRSKPQPDYADGLSGGPDFWEVANVPPGDRLNVRSRPTAQASVVTRLRNGTVLRNLGCRMNGQTRWCKVERRDGRSTGWAAGRFLIESGG